MIKADDGKNYTGNDRYEGYCVELAERLSQVVNFTYELRLVKDNKFGSKDANGNWNGIIGELVRHEADLAVAGLTISLVRERAVEFSMPFMNLGISIMVYKQKEEVIILKLKKLNAINFNNKKINYNRNLICLVLWNH
jgi:ABC-type amino acid transport substrate-binding protein